MILDWDNVVGGDNKPTQINFHGKQLIVLDAEDREQVERLRKAFNVVSGQNYEREWTPDMQKALHRFLAPKPDEPTDFACRAVTGGVEHWARIQHWARILTPDGPRWVTDGGVGVTWDELVRDHPDVEVRR